MRIFVVILLFLVAQNLLCQNEKYRRLVDVADSFYISKDYLSAAFTFSAAFNEWEGQGRRKERYRAACAWALAAYPDSAFYNLQLVAVKGKYHDYDYISRDERLVSLHADDRWEPLLEIIKTNKTEVDAKLDKPLVVLLDSIQKQIYWNIDQINHLAQNNGFLSKEYQSHLNMQPIRDSLNLICITKILDSRGWPDEELIGLDGGQTISSVLVQADVQILEKYLPLLRASVKNRKTSPRILESLEDQLGLKKTGRQIYGSVFGFDPYTRQYFICPLEDPDNVDKRRAELGLVPLAKWAKISGINWDLEQYKKDLPRWIELRKNKSK